VYDEIKNGERPGGSSKEGYIFRRKGGQWLPRQGVTPTEDGIRGNYMTHMAALQSDQSSTVHFHTSFLCLILISTFCLPFNI